MKLHELAHRWAAVIRPSLASAAFKPLQGTTVTRPRIHRRRPMAAPRVWPGALEVRRGAPRAGLGDDRSAM